MRFGLEDSLEAKTAAGIDALACVAPNAHFTQIPGWAAVPDEARRARRLFFTGEEGGRIRVSALVRIRSTPILDYVLADVLRGPLADSPESLLEGLGSLEETLSRFRLLALRVDPYWSGAGCAQVKQGLERLGYGRTQDAQWHARSLEIEIDRDPDGLLQSFKPATRRQVRKGLRMNIDIREGLDDAGLVSFQSLYDRMSATKGATARSGSFFRGLRDLYEAWPNRGFVLSSWSNDELLGAIYIFTLGRRSIYAYGASSSSHPEMPKSHLLHFHAMQRARARGCAVYDMGGFAAGVGDESARTPTQWVNYFKSGFGGREVDFVPAQEKILRPIPYRLLRSLNKLIG